MRLAEAESVTSRVNGQVVWPWQAEPRRLWSLHDMLKHYAGNWLATVITLTRFRWILVFSGPVVKGHPEASMNTARRSFHEHCGSSLSWLREELHALPFSYSLKQQANRVLDELKEVDDTNGDPTRAVFIIDELMSNIQNELKEHLFFVVNGDRAKWFKWDDEVLFGERVAMVFPESTPELAEAGRCFALERWTACVFHLMRALELALHKWAAHLGVDQFSAIKLENWKNILDAAERKIKALEHQTKGANKDAELTYYSETLAHYRVIKDAWRNHVAHARERYDEGRAMSIMNHVGEFMNLLAARP
jgi:hypothetical protein